MQIHLTPAQASQFADLAAFEGRKVEELTAEALNRYLSDEARYITDPQHNPALERWLREEVVAGHMEYLADPSKGVPAEEILARIKARRKKQ